MKKKTTLTNKAQLLLIIFVVVILVFSGMGICFSCYEEIKDDYSKMAFSFTRTAAQYIDGDAVKRYYETNEKDDYYYLVLDFLRAAQMKTNIKYFYVFVPLENDTVYIWDADTSGDFWDLGHHEEYMDNGKQNAMQSFTKDPVEELTVNRDETYGYIASACSPIFDSSGEPVALVAVDIAMEGIIKKLTSFILSVIICVVSVSIIAMILLLFLIRNRITRPIEIINDSAKQMVRKLESNVYSSIEIHTGDEIEELAGSFNRMNSEIRDYLKKLAVMTAEKERIGAELSLATNIQTSMLPSIFPPFPDRSEFDIYASMDPAKEVGGDFYDFFFIDDDHLALVIADVSGKGVPAALFMMASKIMINDHAIMGGTPAEILERVNKQVCAHNKASMFVTVWLGILEISTGTLTASNAGHEYPMINTGGKYEKLTDKHGLPIGTFVTAKYRDYELTLKKGDSIFVYTDGVAEATDANENLFGLERTLDALNSDSDALPPEILKNVRASVDGFVNDAPQFDDLTMLCLKYWGTGK